MRIRDPKTNRVYDSIKLAIIDYCFSTRGQRFRCIECPAFDENIPDRCINIDEERDTYELAKRIGFEVIDN